MHGLPCELDNILVWIITNNFASVCCIQPNLVPRCTLTPPSVYQISRQSDNPFPLYGNFHTLMKRRKSKPSFWKFISWKCLMQFRWNLECRVLMVEGISTAKIIQFVEAARSYVYMNLRYCSFCQYTHGVAHWLLGLHDTLLCVLIWKVLIQKN